MRILHLVPGSGGTFYCQNCLRDHLLVRALRRLGHDVMLVPLYLPMYVGEIAAASDAPLFFGGISTYVREKVAFLRQMPRWLEHLLNRPALLKLAASREGSTSAAELGAMTLSMLKGPEGHQTQEYHRFVHWLRTQPPPDIIHISNALLLGFIPALRDEVKGGFVCNLQDEEPWVNAMQAPYNRLCWEEMSRLAQEVSCFVATSHWYADRMATHLNVARERIDVIYPGLDIPQEKPDFFAASPPTVGYLSRLSPALGFEDIVNAFIQLKQDTHLGELRLRATGGATPADMPFLSDIERKLQTAGIIEATHIQRSFQAAPDASFFAGLTVMSVPARGGEAFGMHIVEAMARGIPVVQPAVGAYPELLQDSGAGVLYDPNQPSGLCHALREILLHPEYARECGERGYAWACQRFSADRMAAEMANLYARIMK